MKDTMTKERIKETRGKYGLSQRSFAKLLGIGEATMVRYESGAQPNRANANLLRAAEDPRFMQGCLERDGERIPAKQRKHASEYVYAFIHLDKEEPEPMDMNEMYDLTLRQEVLTELKADVTCRLIDYMTNNDISPEDGSAVSQLFMNVAETRSTIFEAKNSRDPLLDQIEHYLHFCQTYVSELETDQKAA